MKTQTQEAPFGEGIPEECHAIILDRAYDAISELSCDLFKDCNMPNLWDITFDRVDRDEIIVSNDGLVELHLVPTQSFGRAAFKYEVFRIFPNDGPDDGRVFSSLQDATHWFVHCRIQMRMNASNYRFVNAIEPDREKVTQSILTDLFDGDRDYLGQVRDAVKTALKL